MARQKREVGKSGVYHILLRGVNNLFINDVDYTEFLNLLKKHTEEHKINVIAYVFFKNRIHLVVDALGSDIGVKLKPITTSYARYCNRTRNTMGKLFYDRFKSEPIDTKEDFAGVVSFINAIAVLKDKNYDFCSLNNPIGSLKQRGLTKKEAESVKIYHMYIEDYDCLSKTELAEYVYALCGVYPKAYKALPEKKKKEIIDKLTEKYWVSKSKVFEILGEKKIQGTQNMKPIQKKEKPKKLAEKKPIQKPDNVESSVKNNITVEKEKQQKQKKKDLSVWLL